MTITLAAATPGTPPSSTPRPPLAAVEHERAGLRREPPRDLAHRRQQRQPALAVLDRLVGDAGRAGVDQALGQLRGGGEVQVGEQRLAGAQQRDLGGLAAP